MDVKVCDACRGRITGKFFSIDKHRSSPDGMIYADTLMTTGQKPWPRDVHPTAECVTIALQGELNE